jgi:hypothetical protein
MRASNDEEIASGQGYESKEGCMKVEPVKENASKAKIADMTKKNFRSRNETFPFFLFGYSRLYK